MTDDICAICYEDLTPPTIITLDCSHVFHLECVKKCRSPTCPLCRAPMELHHLAGNDQDSTSPIFAESTNIDCRHSFDFNRFAVPIGIAIVQNTNWTRLTQQLLRPIEDDEMSDDWIDNLYLRVCSFFGVNT